MKNRHIISAAIIITLSLTPMYTYANSAKDASAEIYEQLVTESKDTATTYLADGVNKTDVIAGVTDLDNPNNTYDGAMAIYKAPSFTVSKYNTGKLEITLHNTYTPSEAETTLDKMETEINSRLPENPTQKETLSEIIRFISRTYTYDKGSADVREYQNFIQAYNGDGKIVCNQYAVVTLLLCNRYGIDCRLAEGNDHVFNLIKLDTDDKYIAYDLTKTSVHFPAKVGYMDQLTGSYKIGRNSTEYQKALAKAINTQPYKISLTIIDMIAAIAVMILIAGVASSVYRVLNNKTSHRRYAHNQ